MTNKQHMFRTIYIQIVICCSIWNLFSNGLLRKSSTAVIAAYYLCH